MSSAVLQGRELIYFKHDSEQWKTELFIHSEWRAFPNINSNKQSDEKKGFFFVVSFFFFSYLFKRNNQFTDTVRSLPGRKCKCRRKMQELLVSPSLSITTQIWAVTVFLTSFEAQQVLILSGAKMWQIFNCGQFFSAPTACLHLLCTDKVCLYGHKLG